MRTLLLGGAAALMGFGLLTSSGASAAPVGVDPLRLATQEIKHGLAHDVQYSYGGRQYCFYPDGWRGPGFYWCGYNRRRGYGWGGPMGWRGWGPPGRPPGPRFYDRGPGRRDFDRRDWDRGGRRDFDRRERFR